MIKDLPYGLEGEGSNLSLNIVWMWLISHVIIVNKINHVLTWQEKIYIYNKGWHVFGYCFDSSIH
jgi:hypothetical protein